MKQDRHERSLIAHTSAVQAYSQPHTSALVEGEAFGVQTATRRASADWHALQKEQVHLCTCYLLRGIIVIGVAVIVHIVTSPITQPQIAGSVMVAAIITSVIGAVYLGAGGYHGWRIWHAASKEHRMDHLCEYYADANGNYPVVKDWKTGTDWATPPGQVVVAPQMESQLWQAKRAEQQYARERLRVEQLQGQIDAQRGASPASLPVSALSLADQLLNGQTQQGERESILGYDETGPRRGPWDKLHSFFVVGGSGSGKSSSVAYYAALGILHGARLLVIDPDSQFAESLTTRIEALSPFFLCPVGTDLRSAKRVIEVAEIEACRPGPYPVIFIVDEFSTIMRHGKMGGEWKEIADPLAAVLEEYGQRGRKRQRTSIVIGQIAKATRTGGTELRESMTATFVHRLKPQQAGLVLDAEEAKQCQYLEPGEAMILLSNAVETYRMRIPYADQEAMSMVAEMVMEQKNTVVHTVVHSPNEDPQTMHNECTTVCTTAWEAKRDRIRELRNAGANQTRIISQVWGVSAGGRRNLEYERARSEYREIVEALMMEQE